VFFKVAKQGNPIYSEHNCFLLNAAPTPYFDGGAVQFNKVTNTFFSIQMSSTDWCILLHEYKEQQLWYAISGE
jgi:hypothetical protein